MADFRGLKGFALARESAFFKLEQVARLPAYSSLQVQALQSRAWE